MLLFLLGLNQLRPQWLNHTVLSPFDVLVSFCSSFLSRWGQAIAPKCIIKSSYTCVTLLPLGHLASNVCDAPFHSIFTVLAIWFKT